MQLGLNSEMFNAILYNVKNLISIYKMYVTLKFDDNGCCTIHSISHDGNGLPTKGMWLCPRRWLPGMVKTRASKRWLMGYLVVKNPRLKSTKEEIYREKKLKRSVKNIMKYI